MSHPCGVCDGAKVMPISKAPCWQCNTEALKEKYAQYEKQEALYPQNEAGFVKADAEKPVYALIDAEYEAGLARVLTRGAKKYTDDNWKLCTTPWRTYYSAMRRHLAAVSRGEVYDPETGEFHWYHIACCNMFLAWFERNGLMVDRPDWQPGPTAPDGG